MHLRKLELKTQSTYVRAVRRLDGYLARSPVTATAEDLRLFKFHLVDQGTPPITLNVTLTGLKFFFGVTVGRGEVMSKTSSVRVPQERLFISGRSWATSNAALRRCGGVRGVQRWRACTPGDCPLTALLHPHLEESLLNWTRTFHGEPGIPGCRWQVESAGL